jgi:NAD(P)-dependent dehydrogenase (short-subunit alcohol dehydrogenase family)
MVDLPTTPSFRLDGRRALVTGAGRGIGLAAATALAEAGAHVVLVARSASQVEEAAAAIRARGHAAEAAALDVCDRDGFAALCAARGPFQAFVNNAGTTRPGPSLETTPEEWDAVMDLNARAAFFCAQTVARGLKAAGLPGAIVNVSSQMGHVSGPGRALYSASKFAMEGFTRGMALELGPLGVRVNTLCPTFIETELTRATLADPEARAWIESKIALGRLGRIEDVMGAVLYLCSDARVQHRLGIARGLHAPFEHQIAGRLEGDTVEARRHRAIGRIAAFWRSTTAAILRIAVMASSSEITP